MASTLASRRNLVLLTEEAWQPSLHAQPDAARSLSACAAPRRPPAGSIWRDLAGELESAEDRARRRLRRAAVPGFARRLGDVPRNRQPPTRVALRIRDPGHDLLRRRRRGRSNRIGRHRPLRGDVGARPRAERSSSTRRIGPCRRAAGLILTVPFAARWHFVPHDYWRYTPASLDHLLRKAGFSDVGVYARGQRRHGRVLQVHRLVLPFCPSCSLSSCSRLLVFSP